MIDQITRTLGFVSLTSTLIIGRTYASRSIFEDNDGNGISNTDLRNGNIHLDDIT